MDKTILGIYVFLICLLFLPVVIYADEIVDEIPIGGIIIWTGSDDDFNNYGYMNNNTDWHLCNGLNGTTDLQGKFIVGYDPEDNDYDRFGYTGGEKKTRFNS